MIYHGDLIINKNTDPKQYKDITKITGHLAIYAYAKLEALKSVGGDLSLNAKLEAPQLKGVGGDVFIRANAKLEALKSVGGRLYLNTNTNLGALESVGGDLSLNDSTKLEAPQLKGVGGDVFIHANAKLEAPQLKGVEGHLTIDWDAKLEAPKLYPKGFENFTIQDGIPCVVFSKKKINNTVVLNCREAKIKKQRIVGKKIHVATNGDKFAHGKNVSEALQELHFKTSNRDISQFKNMPKNTVKTVDEWVFAYRMVTGACRYGIDSFLKTKGKLKKTYTLKEVLEATQDEWGYKSFRETVINE